MTINAYDILYLVALTTVVLLALTIGTLVIDYLYKHND